MDRRVYDEFIRAANLLTARCNEIINKPNGIVTLEEQGVSADAFIRLSSALVQVGEELSAKRLGRRFDDADFEDALEKARRAVH